MIVSIELLKAFFFIITIFCTLNRSHSRDVWRIVVLNITSLSLYLSSFSFSISIFIFFLHKFSNKINNFCFRNHFFLFIKAKPSSIFYILVLKCLCMGMCGFLILIPFCFIAEKTILENCYDKLKNMDITQFSV